ncbi:MAG: pyridoxal-dependent decarboxylase, partial [Verrucomicrobiales bacterium]
GGDSYQTFAQKADYLWREDDSAEWWDMAKRTLECTRPMLGLRAYGILVAGRGGLVQAYIDHALEVTRQFARLLVAADDFELLVEPESNILCYRFVLDGVDEPELNQINGRIRKELADSGDFYIVQIEKHGRTYLRSAVMNPFAEESTCVSLLERIRTSKVVGEARSGRGA